METCQNKTAKVNMSSRVLFLTCGIDWAPLNIWMCEFEPRLTHRMRFSSEEQPVRGPRTFLLIRRSMLLNALNISNVNPLYTACYVKAINSMHMIKLFYLTGKYMIFIKKSFCLWNTCGTFFLVNIVSNSFSSQHSKQIE